MKRTRLKQTVAVARIEIGKSLFSLRALPIYLLASLPVLIMSLLVVVSLLFEPPPELGTLTGAAMLYAHLFQFTLRFVIYIGCVWIFMNLFRGEVLDRSLHYYFLAPIRRDVLVLGKFLAGWIASSFLFVGTTLVSLVLLYSYFGVSRALGHLIGGPGLVQTLAYAGTSALACLGYGAVFLVVGLLFRNPIVPGLLIWVWEWANPFLPVLLKKFSVIFYLQSLLPVGIDVGPFAVIAKPASPWLAIPGLLLFTAAMLAAGGLCIRKMEIAYGGD